MPCLLKIAAITRVTLSRRSLLFLKTIGRAGLGSLAFRGQAGLSTVRSNYLACRTQACGLKNSARKYWVIQDVACQPTPGLRRSVWARFLHCANADAPIT